MTDSRDRIEFTLTAKSEEAPGAIRAAVRAFFMTEKEATRTRNTFGRVRCTPAQFGRFIAFRVEEGVPNNRVLDLNIKYIEAAREEPMVDVSSRTSLIGGEYTQGNRDD